MARLAPLPTLPLPHDVLMPRCTVPLCASTPRSTSQYIAEHDKRLRASAEALRRWAAVQPSLEVRRRLCVHSWQHAAPCACASWAAEAAPCSLPACRPSAATRACPPRCCRAWSACGRSARRSRPSRCSRCSSCSSCSRCSRRRAALWRRTAAVMKATRQPGNSKSPLQQTAGAAPPRNAPPAALPNVQCASSACAV